MTFTNVYWVSDKYTRPTQFSLPISGHLGIQFEQVKQDPVTAGWYFNENQIMGYSTKLTNGAQPEYFLSGDGVLPTIICKPNKY